MKLKRYTFYALYADVLNSFDETSAGKFIVRICKYMFDDTDMFQGKELNFDDTTMQTYFNLCKIKMDVSKEHKAVGSIDGNQRRTQEPTRETMTYTEFRQRNPQIIGELYGKLEALITEVDWADVADKMTADYTTLKAAYKTKM